MSIFWGPFFSVFIDKKFIQNLSENVLGSALKSCIEWMVNKCQNDFGKSFYGDITSFFRSKNLSVNTWRLGPDIRCFICAEHCGKAPSFVLTLLVRKKIQKVGSFFHIFVAFSGNLNFNQNVDNSVHLFRGPWISLLMPSLRRLARLPTSLPISYQNKSKRQFLRDLLYNRRSNVMQARQNI